MDAAQAVKEIIATAMEEARRVAREDEERLGRPLTASEQGQIADMVERQLRLALAESR